MYCLSGNALQIHSCVAGNGLILVSRGMWEFLNTVQKNAYFPKHHAREIGCILYFFQALKIHK
jgi:hypothetical protein